MKSLTLPGVILVTTILSSCSSTGEFADFFKSPAEEGELDLLIGSVEPKGFIVFFEAGSANILDANVEVLKEAIRIIENNGGALIRVVGHVDAKEAADATNGGTAEIAIELDDSRAEYVAKYLIDHGIDKNRIEVIGIDAAGNFGASEGAALIDRRVDIMIVK